MSYPYEFALFAAINRNRVYDKVIEALERAAEAEGITQSQIAERAGRKQSQISAWLSGPSNWTLDTVSDLLRSVHASMEYSVVFDTDRTQSNIFHPASLEPDKGRPLVEATATATVRPQLTEIEGTKQWQTPPQSNQVSQWFQGSGTSSLEKSIPIPQ